jgi:parvulin-like peptidyl-prolyl isomerase
MFNLLLKCLSLISLLSSILCFHHTSIIMTKQMTTNNLNNNNNIHNFKYNTKPSKTTSSSIQMNIFSDAFRFFTNMNKQASAKHILIKGPQIQAIDKLKILKDELNASKDINLAFSELASKVSECPSASRGIELM